MVKLPASACSKTVRLNSALARSYTGSQGWSVPRGPRTTNPPPWPTSRLPRLRSPCGRVPRVGQQVEDRAEPAEERRDVGLGPVQRGGDRFAGVVQHRVRGPARPPPLTQDPDVERGEPGQPPVHRPDLPRLPPER